MEKPVSSMNITCYGMKIKESRRKNPSAGWTFPAMQGFPPYQWHPRMVISISMVEVPLYLDNHLNLPISSGATIPLESSSRITQDVGPLSQATVGKRCKWTEEEHRNFLRGVEIYGKGRWNLISKKVVKTKTPSQVASHAQKYFLRQNVAPDKRKRYSIHDITTAAVISDPQPQPRQHHVESPAEPPALVLQQQLQHPTALTAQIAAPVESQAFGRISHVSSPIRSLDEEDLFDYMLHCPIWNSDPDLD